jgi:hypothetical protein
MRSFSNFGFRVFVSTMIISELIITAPDCKGLVEVRSLFADTHALAVSRWTLPCSRGTLIGFPPRAPRSGLRTAILAQHCCTQQHTPTSASVIPASPARVNHAYQTYKIPGFPAVQGPGRRIELRQYYFAKYQGIETNARVRQRHSKMKVRVLALAHTPKRISFRNFREE